MDNEKYKGLGTKVSPEYDLLLNSICDILRVDVYHLMQWFAYTLIRASSPQHELTPEVRRIMTLLESDAGWQQAFNIANPRRLQVSQAILILEQEGKKGFGAVMIDKPFMGEARQTECVDDILERVTEVTMHGIYRRLRRLGASMECKHLSDILLTLIERQSAELSDEADRFEYPGMGDIADNGRHYAYGKKTKAKKHRTPDSAAGTQQQTIRFSPDDVPDLPELSEHPAADQPSDQPADSIPDGLARPFDQEY